MADGQHLAILKQGRAAWNQWRTQNPKAQPDLTWADLTCANLLRANLAVADLTGAKLTRADVTGANLHRANLTVADLTGADLTRADLTEVNFAVADLTEAKLPMADLSLGKLRSANLTGANLRGAKLIRADVTGANLHRANLNVADLTGADLTRADLAKAILSETVLVDTNLAGTAGLESCRHWGPSTIDHRTLLKSGRLPLAFLRGCGLPDLLIEYLPSLLNEPIQFYPCFISHSSADQGFAERLHADLQNKGVRCWYAPEDMKIGDKIRDRIDESVRIFDKLLLILSKHSITSQWVEQEVETALRKEREQKRTVLFPIRLDDAIMKSEGGWPALIRNTRHIGDFREWEIHAKYQEAFDRLLRDLKRDEPSPYGDGDVLG